MVRLVALGLVVLSVSGASVAELPNDAPEGKRWMSCFIRLKDAGAQYSSQAIAVGGYWLIDVPEGTRSETERRLKDMWVNEYVSRVPSEFPGKIADTQNGTGYDARCTSYGSRGEWASFVAHVKEPVTSSSVLRSDFVPSFAEAWVSTREHARGYQGEVAASGSVKGKRSSGEEPKPESGKGRQANNSQDAKPAPDGPSAAERHAAVEQRNREKQAKYEAEMKAWRDQIDAQKAEEERKKAKLEADKQAAAQQLSAFETEQAAHRRNMEKHAQLVLENQAAQQRHALCLAGDRAACDAALQGKPVGVAQKDPGEASTDTDARQCVTQPVLSPNEAFKGSIKAVVTNGCAKPVDIRICLMRTGGWNCGMTLGLKPQSQWSWWTMQPEDGVFWDARTSGSNRNLDHPAGS